MKLKKILTLLLTVAILLSMASCGTSKEESDKDKPQKEDKVTVSVDIGIEDGDAEDEDETEKTEAYLICAEYGYEPFAYMDESLTGFDVDIINKAAELGGFKVYMSNETYDGGLNALANGDYNGMISAVEKTADRKNYFDFSDPYFTDGIAVIVKNDSEIKSLFDLDGKTLGVVTDSTSEYVASYDSDAYGYDIVAYENYDAVYEALGKGSIDALAEEFSSAGWRIYNFNYEMSALPVFLWKTEYYFVVAKDKNEELLQSFNSALEEMKQSGEYEKILSRYGLNNFVK